MSFRAFFQGAILGAGLYLACLGVHFLRVGELREFPGCSPDPTFYVLNLPAWIAGPILPRHSIGPQSIGKPAEQELLDSERSFSSFGFAALGLSFYASITGAAWLFRARSKRRGQVGS
ncbi:MAG: hypothetical protein U0359_31915 [Byssovorax sp.]